MDANPFLVIAGSTRPNRRSPVIAEWVAQTGREATGEAFHVVDLRDLDLGLDDEPGIPAAHPYTQPSTQRWSERVQGAAGVVLVTPQYNWGYPAALKNAIDHLYREWRDKPALIVTYGGHGGNKCAAQLREVLTGVNTRLTATSPGLVLARARIEANDGAVDPAVDFRDQAEGVREAVLELVSLANTPTS